MYINSQLTFCGKNKAQEKIITKNISKSSSKIISQKEYAKLLEYKKLYEKMEQEYKNDNYKEIMAQRAKYLLSIEKNISDASKKFKDEPFDV